LSVKSGLKFLGWLQLLNMPVMKITSLIVTLSAAVISIHIATLPNPSKSQQDLGHTTNRILLLGSQALLKDSRHKDDDQNKKK
jgi:hypothetical protein